MKITNRTRIEYTAIYFILLTFMEIQITEQHILF